MALLFSAVTVKREVDDGILPDGPWFSAANSKPITVKCEVDGGSAVDDVDHLPLKERMEMMLVGGLSGSSLGIESSGRVPMCCVDAAVKEKACFLEDISTGDSARVEGSTSVCCAGESKEGGHSKDAGQEQSYTDGGPVTNAVEVPTIAIPVHSCEAALWSSTVNKFHDMGSTRESNLQEAKLNGHICSCLVPCPEAKGLVGEVDTNSHNSSSSLISPCRDGQGGLSSVDMQTVQVKSEIQDQPEIDKLDHISLQERRKMLFTSRGSVLGDFYDSKCSQISGPCALRSGLQQEVSLGDSAHLVKDGHTADSKFTKERDYAHNIHDTSDGQSNGFKKANMHEVKTNDPTCTYQLSLPEVRAPIVVREKVDVNAGNELLPLSSFPIQVKVENENLENGLIGPCRNGSGSFPNADIVAVKVKTGIFDEFHADDLDHIPLQERIKKLVASRDSNLNFSRDLNCLQDNVSCTLDDAVGLVDVKTSGMTVRRRRKKAVNCRDSKDTACPPCPPGYNPIVSVKSEASCLTLPQKRKKIAMDLVEKVHVPYVPECDPIDSRNAEARHFTLRRKRKKTVVDSVEAALEEDAPGLLQVLVERGIKVDELKLYGEAEDEGALDISDSEDGFGELETVISKLFSQPSNLLKFAPLRRAKGSRVSYYCLACLVSLIEQTRYLQFRKWPIEWGWCRDLQSFIFVFERHNRIVLERPEYGYATYFFELVGSLPIDWQIKRLVTTMRLTSFSRTTLIENKALLVGEDLTEGEARVLEEYGWIPNSGLGTMLNYCDRVVHDRKNEGNISDWRCKIGKLLMNGHDGGSIVLFNLPTKVVEYKGNQSLQIKLELEAEMV